MLTRCCSIGRLLLAGILVLGWSRLVRCAGAADAPARHTVVSIDRDSFRINGRPTYEGRTYRGVPLEGLLFNTRMVQGIFDDQNPETRPLWNYPDGRPWDPERNTSEFVAAMPDWRAHGVLAFTLNLQGGSPQGYGNKGWINSAFAPDGSPRPDSFRRLERILDRADDLGMVVFLGLFYFGQDQYLRDEAAVYRAVDTTLAWLQERRYRNLVIEICNECDSRSYDHAVLRPPGVVALIRHARAAGPEGARFPVGVSMGGCVVPTPEIVAASDVVFLHGNSRLPPGKTPDALRDVIRKTRALPGFRPMPVVVNEDDHYGFEQEDNNLWAATSAHVSWGFFDFRRPGEPFADGFQSVPVDWTISSARKRQFFDAVARMTGESRPAATAATAPGR